MATIYRAYANGEEITDFPINGVETQEIWGGDTLLWKKGETVDNNFVYITVGDALEYLVPPSSFSMYMRNITLVSENGIQLSNKDIEAGFFGQEEKTISNNTRRYTSRAYLLFKAKTKKARENIDKIFFYSISFDGKDTDEDFPVFPYDENNKNVTKKQAKIIYGDNVFSISNYSESNGISMIDNHIYNVSIGGYNPGLHFSKYRSDSGVVIKEFKSKEELLAWAIS